MKKILIIGGSGTIGSAIVNELQSDSEVLTASLNNGDFKVDMADSASIQALFQQTGKLDAIVCAASRGVVFKPLTEMSVADYEASLQQKLLGQIQVALAGMPALNAGGSVTLTTGVMNVDFVMNGSAASMVNNAVEGFVKAAALDTPNGIRINAVSPALLDESVEAYGAFCPGFNTVPATKVAKTYRRSIYGIQTGLVLVAQ